MLFVQDFQRGTVDIKLSNYPDFRLFIDQSPGLALLFTESSSHLGRAAAEYSIITGQSFKSSENYSAVRIFRIRFGL